MPMIFRIKRQRIKILQLDGQNLFQLDDSLPPGEDDDPVVGFHHAFARRDDDGVVTDDAGDQHAFGKGDFVQRLAHDVRGLQSHRLDHLGLFALDGDGRKDFSLSRVLQDGIDGRKPGADHLLQPDGGHQGEVAEPADLGDGLLGSHPFGQQGGENIGLLVAGQGDHRVHVLNVLLGQQVLVRTVAVKDHGLVEPFGQNAAAARILFHDLGVHRLVFQEAGQAVPDPPAADDHHPSNRIQGFVENLQGFEDLLLFADEIHQVAPLKPVASPGNDQLFVAHHGGHQQPAGVHHPGKIL